MHCCGHSYSYKQSSAEGFFWLLAVRRVRSSCYAVFCTSVSAVYRILARMIIHTLILIFRGDFPPDQGGSRNETGRIARRLQSPPFEDGQLEIRPRGMARCLLCCPRCRLFSKLLCTCWCRHQRTSHLSTYSGVYVIIMQHVAVSMKPLNPLNPPIHNPPERQ